MSQLHLGRSVVHATAYPLIRYRSTVLRLAIQRSRADEALALAVSILPLWVQSLVIHWWPRPFLPDRVVLKILKPDWDDEFLSEKRMYNKLRALQRLYIPTLYGEAEYDGQRALLISYIDGDTLDSKPAAETRGGV